MNSNASSPALLAVLSTVLALACLSGCRSSGHAYAGTLGSIRFEASLHPEESTDTGRIAFEALDRDVTIRAFEAVLYDDLDGDSALGEGELRKTTRGTAAVPAQTLHAAAFSIPAALTRPRLRIEVDTSRGVTVMDAFVIQPAPK